MQQDFLDGEDVVLGSEKEQQQRQVPSHGSGFPGSGKSREAVKERTKQLKRKKSAGSKQQQCCSSCGQTGHKASTCNKPGPAAPPGAPKPEKAARRRTTTAAGSPSPTVLIQAPDMTTTNGILNTVAQSLFFLNGNVLQVIHGVQQQTQLLVEIRDSVKDAVAVANHAGAPNAVGGAAAGGIAGGAAAGGVGVAGMLVGMAVGNAGGGGLDTPANLQPRGFDPLPSPLAGGAGLWPFGGDMGSPAGCGGLPFGVQHCE